MELRPGVTRTANFDVDEVLREATKAGYATFVLPDRGIVDRETFFDAIRTTLPLDPPLTSSHSWDAMSDSLWEGLHTLPEKGIVVLWPNSRTMADAAPADFVTAIEVLNDVAASLRNREATTRPIKELVVIVG